MFVPTIYIENSNDNMSVEVSDKKLHHLNQVLRLRDGDKVNISDGNGLISYGNFINSRCFKTCIGQLYHSCHSIFWLCTSRQEAQVFSSTYKRKAHC